MPIQGKQIAAATITQDRLNLTDPVNNLDAATKQWVITQIQNSVYGRDWKDSVRVATTTNVNIASPGTTIDGVTLNVNDRVLVKNQTTASQNGIYVFNGSAAAMTRSADANSSTNVTPEMAVAVEEGTTNQLTMWKLTTTGVITLGTTNLTFAPFYTFTQALASVNNKFMAASTTAADGDVACGVSIVTTPANGSYVTVLVNGIAEAVGDGVKTKACYFSADNGATAKTIATIASGDKLYWVGSVASYQLSSSTDTVSFLYES